MGDVNEGHHGNRPTHVAQAACDGERFEAAYARAAQEIWSGRGNAHNLLRW